MRRGPAPHSFTFARFPLRPREGSPARRPSLPGPLRSTAQCGAPPSSPKAAKTSTRRWLRQRPGWLPCRSCSGRPGTRLSKLLRWPSPPKRVTTQLEASSPGQSTSRRPRYPFSRRSRASTACGARLRWQRLRGGRLQLHLRPLQVAPAPATPPPPQPCRASAAPAPAPPSYATSPCRSSTASQTLTPTRTPLRLTGLLKTPGPRASRNSCTPSFASGRLATGTQWSCWNAASVACGPRLATWRSQMCCHRRGQTWRPWCGTCKRKSLRASRRPGLGDACDRPSGQPTPSGRATLWKTSSQNSTSRTTLRYLPTRSSKAFGLEREAGVLVSNPCRVVGGLLVARDWPRATAGCAGRPSARNQVCEHVATDLLSACCCGSSCLLG
mmetsp:Transcript_10092/g.39308  ORF Transcript_10092/g.39308 Transcript_10092/m.39308 type:complete len:384 (+) Transcript_10092:2023-3174(+)